MVSRPRYAPIFAIWRTLISIHQSVVVAGGGGQIRIIFILFRFNSAHHMQLIGACHSQQMTTLSHDKEASFEWSQWTALCDHRLQS